MSVFATTADAATVPAGGDNVRQELRRLGLLFFASGLPALLYQLVWQRALFRIFGVNAESVTVVVAAFMLGLGLGGLAGGALSQRRKLALLPLLAAIEAMTALFGVLSLAIFERVGDALAGAALPWIAAATLALVLVPTLLMGATLPLLVGHLARRSGNVGHALGMLYHVNMLGAASACLIAAVALFPLLGMHGTIMVAAAINALVAASALAMHLRERDGGSEQVALPTRSTATSAAALRQTTSLSSPDACATTRVIARTPNEVTGDARLRQALAPSNFGTVLALAAAGGFVALSWELFLFRATSLASGSSAFAFAVTLGAFLVGLASGSRVAAESCERFGANATLVRHAQCGVLAASVAGVMFLPLMAASARFGATMLGVGVLMVYFLSRWWGVMLPCLAHLGVRSDDRTGVNTGLLVLSNIGGSAAGTVLTGFVLMDHVGLVRLAQILVVAGLLCAAALQTLAPRINAPSGLAASDRLDNPSVALAVSSSGHTLPALAVAAMFGVAALPTLTPRLFELLQFGGDARATEPFAAIVENRSGVVTVARDGTVFGHGAYDGAFSTDLVHDVNGIVRPFALSLFHPDPRDVLMIGLASGSWAKVIASHPQVRSLTIVEINPAYAALIAAEPKVASVLRDPKVTFVNDDGRRWLRRHAKLRFDAIVMNTTFHYRANATNLLAAEFIDGLKQHLNPGGIVFYNTTGSRRVQRTGCLAYPHGARFTNHVVLSDAPLDWDFDRWERRLLEHRIDGHPVLELARSADRARFDALMSLRQQALGTAPPAAQTAIEPCAALLDRTAGLAPVTDDNMGTEWTSWRETP